MEVTHPIPPHPTPANSQPTLSHPTPVPQSPVRICCPAHPLPSTCKHVLSLPTLRTINGPARPCPTNPTPSRAIQPIRAHIHAHTDSLFYPHSTWLPSHSTAVRNECTSPVHVPSCTHDPAPNSCPIPGRSAAPPDLFFAEFNRTAPPQRCRGPSRALQCKPCKPREACRGAGAFMRAARPPVCGRTVQPSPRLARTEGELGTSHAPPSLRRMKGRRGAEAAWGHRWYHGMARCALRTQLGCKHTPTAGRGSLFQLHCEPENASRAGTTHRRLQACQPGRQCLCAVCCQPWPLRHSCPIGGFQADLGRPPHPPWPRAAPSSPLGAPVLASNERQRQGGAAGDAEQGAAAAGGTSGAAVSRPPAPCVAVGSAVRKARAGASAHPCTCVAACAYLQSSVVLSPSCLDRRSSV